MKKLFFLTLALLSFGASAGALMPVTPINISGAILGYSIDREGLSIQVTSGGCISENNFEVTVLETYPVQIIIKQTSPDSCEANIPYGQNVLFTYEKLGLKSGEIIRVNVSKSAKFRIE